MAKYKLSNTAKEEFIRIHHFGADRFEVRRADKYFNELFIYFDKIATNPFSFEAVDYIREGYRRCPCGYDTIYYRLIKNEVEIMSIIGSQDITQNCECK